MQRYRIFHPEIITLHNELTLTPEATNHLSRVLRVRVGEPITLFNGQGGEYHGTVVIVEKRKVAVRIEQFIPVERESPMAIHLYPVISRGDKMDMVVQKAVELGVSAITPLFSDYCAVKLPADRLEKKLQHWQQVIISACEQCERNQIPRLNPVLDFSQAIAQTQSDLALILHPYEKSKPLTELLKGIHSIDCFVGPEGGFSEAEVQQALTKQIQPFQLGPRILRTETAPIVGLSVLQYVAGDLAANEDAFTPFPHSL